MSKKQNHPKNLFKILFIIFLVFSAPVQSEQTKPAIEYIKTIIEQKFEKEKLGVGISIAIYENGEDKFFTYGLAKKETDEVVTSQHIFEIASITKTFTAAILIKLVNEGTVSLDDHVAKYLPKKVKVPQINDKHITLLDLVTHRSGLPRSPSNAPPINIANPYANYTIKDMYDFLSGYDLTREIGAEYEYSNIGMGLLGHALELKTGKTYEELVHETVFKPLKMTSSFVNIPPSHQDKFVNGYNTDLSYMPHWQMPTLAAAGSIKSNVIDMLIYLKANLIGTDPISETLRLTHKIYNDGPENGAKVGLAWNIITRGVNPYYWHNGQISGFHSFIGFDKVTQKGIIILANTRNDIDQIGHSYLNNTLKQLVDVKARKEIEVSVESLKKLEGAYEFSPNFFIKVSVDNRQLFVQATNQPRFPVYAKSLKAFFLKAVDADLEFELNEAGEGMALILIQNNQVIKGKKIQ